MGCSAVEALPTAVPWPPAATTVVAASVIAPAAFTGVAACCCAPQNIASQLRELAELKNAGALSEREYTAAKERVLGGDGQQLKDGYYRYTYYTNTYPNLAEAGRVVCVWLVLYFSLVYWGICTVVIAF